MRPSDEIHHYPRMLELIQERIQSSSICDENKRAISDYQNFVVANGTGLARQTKVLETLLLIARKVNKPFDKLKMEDIFAWVKSIETSDYTDWTKHDYKVIFKQFYRWVRKVTSYPEEVAWIKPQAGKRRLLPEELISMEEV